MLLFFLLVNQHSVSEFVSLINNGFLSLLILSQSEISTSTSTVNVLNWYFVPHEWYSQIDLYPYLPLHGTSLTLLSISCYCVKLHSRKRWQTLLYGNEIKDPHVKLGILHTGTHPSYVTRK